MAKPIWLTRIIATGLYTGYSPIVSGTVGTVPAWVLLWFFFPQNIVMQVILFAAIFLISVVSSTAAEELFGHDSKKIVIDEWAGMTVSVLFLPHTLTSYLMAFAAFRIFDVIKLPPAAQCEKLPGGWGVTMDDIIAGIQTNILVLIILLLLGTS
jgi:phosphatidylglycerophosphatase A